MLSLDELNIWNEENERDDTLFYVELTIYQRGYNKRQWLEKPLDKVVMQTNEIEAAIKYIEYLKNLCKNFRIRLMCADSIYNGNIEYQSVKEYTFSDIEMENDD